MTWLRRLSPTRVVLVGLAILAAGCSSARTAPATAEAPVDPNQPFALVAADWGGYHAFRDRLAGVSRPEGDTRLTTAVAIDER
jgi:hypothetical protein